MIERLVQMQARTGQLIPSIGHRLNPDGLGRVFDGQRRYVAAMAGPELAGSDAF